MKINKNIFALILFFISFNIFSQLNTDQNGLKSTVIGPISANAEQAKRYEIASIGYNSHHWQYGGLIIIELFNQYYSTGYEKYIIENSYGQGTEGSSTVIKLVDSHGFIHSGKIALGTPVDLSTAVGDYINKRLPIYLDVRYYAKYKVKITYLQDKVNVITDNNQIKIDDNPSPMDITDFPESNALNINLAINGTGNHYIENGNVGIGTSKPKNKLDVKGTVHAQEVKVDMDWNWPDFVFKKEYNLPTLKEVEEHIVEKGHLENIPSEEEILKNGINLGEMDSKLLQKIEELTLYIIEQNKKISVQEDKIKELEKEKIAFKSLSERLTKIEQQLR